MKETLRSGPIDQDYVFCVCTFDANQYILSVLVCDFLRV